MRITGGEFRSRPLKAPKGSATRPTSDRVREALFSILASRASRAGSVLDLYAGTGALGLEALSRGATSVVFVERSKEALAALGANVASLGVGARARVLASSVERAATRLSGERFDLVFVDPPYADVASGAAVTLLREHVVPLIADGGALVLEHSSRDESPTLNGLAREDARTYGDTTLSFYVTRPSPG